MGGPKIIKKKNPSVSNQVGYKKKLLTFNEIGVKLNNNKELQHFVVTCIKHFIVCRKHTNFGNEKTCFILH